MAGLGSTKVLRQCILVVYFGVRPICNLCCLGSVPLSFCQSMLRSGYVLVLRCLLSLFPGQLVIMSLMALWVLVHCPLSCCWHTVSVRSTEPPLWPQVPASVSAWPPACPALGQKPFRIKLAPTRRPQCNRDSHTH